MKTIIFLGFVITVIGICIKNEGVLAVGFIMLCCSIFAKATG